MNQPVEGQPVLVGYDVNGQPIYQAPAPAPAPAPAAPAADDGGALRKIVEQQGRELALFRAGLGDLTEDQATALFAVAGDKADKASLVEKATTLGFVQPPAAPAAVPGATAPAAEAAPAPAPAVTPAPVAPAAVQPAGVALLPGETQLSDQRASLATAGGAPLQPGSVDPYAKGLAEFDAARAQGAAREDAASAFVGEVIAAAVAGDQRVLTERVGTGKGPGA